MTAVPQSDTQRRMTRAATARSSDQSGSSKAGAIVHCRLTMGQQEHRYEGTEARSDLETLKSRNVV